MKQCPICDTEYDNNHTTCPTDGALLTITNDWAPGTVIRGKYRIIAQVGRGGMGTVYKAEHIALEEVRALKVMALNLASDPKFVRRFRQEAQVARRLRHPNVVHVDDLDQGDDGSLFITMDFVDGVSLKELMRALQGPMPVARTMGIIRGLADALGAAHALGLVHRDIKPENILLAHDTQGRDVPKVLDFGIVAMKESSATLSTSLLLTPRYASPEQWRGMKSDSLDGRADLYALGMTWYEMLAGRLPFHAHTNEGWMTAHLMDAPPPPSHWNSELAQYPHLNSLVLKLIAKDREQRPHDAQSFLQELNLLEAQLSWTQPDSKPTPINSRTEIKTPTAPVNPTVSSIELMGEPGAGQTRPFGQPFSATTLAQSASTRFQNATNILVTTATLSSPDVASPTSRRPSRIGLLILLGTSVLIGAIVLGLIYKAETTPLATLPPDRLRSLPPPPPIPVEKNSPASATPAEGTALTNSPPKRVVPPSPLPSTAPASVPAPKTSVDAGALFQQGLQFQQKGQFPQAVNAYQPSCEGGNDGSCSNLGYLYEHGQGVTQDYKRAAQFYQKACDDGAAFGCSNLANLYTNGQGVAQEYERAAQLYKKACDGSAAVGCSNLGYLYEHGQGVAQDYNHAAQFYQKACDGGYASACADSKRVSGLAAAIGIGASNQPPPASQTGTPRIQVGGAVQAAKMIRQVPPVYPVLAKQAHVTGTVVLHAIVGKDGTIEKLQLVSGPPLLVQAAIDAVKQWQYSPTLLNGQPVEVDTSIDVNFTLGG